VAGHALFFAGAVTTVVEVAKCFGDDPFLGDSWACASFHMTDFLTFGAMSLSSHGLTRFAEEVDKVPEFKQHVGNAINRATGIGYMNHKMDEMDKWVGGPRQPDADDALTKRH
jgi:hypothetical protein